MKKMIITVGLSSALTISKDVLEQTGKLAKVIVPFAKDKSIEVISTDNNEAEIITAALKQILYLTGVLKEGLSENQFSYRGNSAEILEYEEWREFIDKKFQHYEVLVIVCRDHKIYAPREIKVMQGYLQLGTAAELEPLFF